MNVLEKILEEIDVLIEKHKNKAYEFVAKEPLTKCYTDTDIEQIKVHELAVIKKRIRSHMDEVKNDGWIPVSERLPEKAGTYIVSAKDGKREIVTFVKWQNRFKKWDLSGARAYWKINAWKPLPEPYKGE